MNDAAAALYHCVRCAACARGDARSYVYIKGLFLYKKQPFSLLYYLPYDPSALTAPGQVTKDI